MATGLFAVILGVFLIVLNCLISKREEDDLEEYVQRQLTRSRSGHRLERDVETGCLTTRHNRRLKETLQNNDELTMPKSNITPVTSEAVTPTASVGTYEPEPVLMNTPTVLTSTEIYFKTFVNLEVEASGEMLLDKIMEEDSNYGEDKHHREHISPNENDTKHLLGNGHQTSINITRI